MLAVIEENRTLSVAAVIGASAVATALLDLIAKQSPDADGWLWRGSATELLEALKGVVSLDTAKAKGWPKAANTLSGLLKRLAPALRRSGVIIERDRDNRERKLRIKLEEVSKTSSPSSPSSFGSIFNMLPGDDPRDDPNAPPKGSSLGPSLEVSPQTFDNTKGVDFGAGPDGPEDDLQSILHPDPLTWATSRKARYDRRLRRRHDHRARRSRRPHPDRGRRQTALA
jgi:hypothetical protein